MAFYFSLKKLIKLTKKLLTINLPSDIMKKHCESAVNKILWKGSEEAKRGRL